MFGGMNSYGMLLSGLQEEFYTEPINLFETESSKLYNKSIKKIVLNEDLLFICLTEDLEIFYYLCTLP